MHYYLLLIHSYFRWFVLLAALVSIAIAAMGSFKPMPIKPLGKLAKTLFVIVMDVQFLLGLVLLFISPMVRDSLSHMGETMKIKEQRGIVVEHLLLMIVALAFAHIGAVKAKKAGSDQGFYKAMLLWFSLSLIAILGGIPWWRPLFR